MNIIQQQDRLKSLPEEVLIEYIANPTGEVPTFLALGEIERRKVMRNKYAAQQAEQPPVSEQIIQESMTARMPRPMDMVGGLGRSNRQEALRRETAPPMAPSGDAGITALPTPNVGQNYAQGGVVGYAAGGELSIADIQRLREEGYDIPIGSTIDPRLSEAARLTALDEKFGRRDSPGLLAELGRKFMMTDKSQLKQRILNRADRKDFGMLPVGVGPYDREAVPIGITELLASGAEPSPISYDADGELEEYSSGISSIPLVNSSSQLPGPLGLLGSGIEAVTDFTGNTINKYLREPVDATIRSLRKPPLTEEEIQAELNEQDLKNLAKEQDNQVDIIQKRDDARLEKELENIDKTGTNVADNAGTNVAGGNAGGNAVGNAGGDAPILTEKDINDIRLQKQQNYYDGIKAEQAALADVFGLQSSKDFYEAEKEFMQAERDKYAGDKDSALNMALINAGLGIAGGTSSNALENIASGAQTGVTSYTKDLKDIRDEDRLFNKELRSLDRLRRAEGRADLTEYKANQLALQKLLQDSGLSTAEFAEISDEAMKSAQGLHKLLDPNGWKEFGPDGASTKVKKQAQRDAIMNTYNQNVNNALRTGNINYLSTSADNTGFTARLIK